MKFTRTHALAVVAIGILAGGILTAAAAGMGPFTSSAQHAIDLSQSTHTHHLLRLAQAQAANTPAPPPGFIPPSSDARATVGVGVSAPSADQLAAFSALRRRATGVDAASTSADALDVLSTPEREWSVNPSLGRVVFSGPGNAAVIIVPGDGELCLVVAGFPFGSSSGCTNSTDAESDGLWQSGYVGPALGGYTLEGVLPDGAADVTVSRTGASDLAVQLTADNGFALSSQSPLVALSFTAKDGTRHSEHLVN